jgi:hypothetical protein
MFTWLKNLFTLEPKLKGVDRVFSDWKLISYEDLLEHFEVKDIAKERGENNSPATTAKTPDDFHNKLTTRFKKIVSDRTSDITRHLDSLENNATRAKEKLDFLDGIKAKFKNKLDDDLEKYEPIITGANSIVRSRKEELNEFKSLNKLTRDADYPDALMWHYFVLIFLVVIESLVNASFFARGSTSGLAGGVTIAVIISGINVVLGYMVGKYWAKLSWSINQVLKTVGIFGFALWAFVTACFNLTVGHVRTRFEEGDTDAMNTGFEAFLNSPFGLTDFSSWMLVLIGSLFAIIALFDGLKSDDKYPGYGAVVRKLKDALDELHSEVDDLKANANDYYNTFLSKGDTAIKDLGQDATTLRSTHDFVKERINNEYPKYCNYYQTVFADLIGSYRNTNLESREDAAPDYFTKEPILEWDRDNRDDQLLGLNTKIDKVSSELQVKTDQWSKERQELEQIKIDFLNDLRKYDSIS